MRDAVLSLLSDIRAMSTPSFVRRAEMLERWTRHALLEHASIASFSRFSLHLLAVAAPAELIERAHRAAIEEVEHARLAFAIASYFGGGERLGPGPLPISDNALGTTDLLSVTIAATEEGCIGETRAAIAAHREAADSPRGPISDVLTLIARDEASHADLAFSFVSWACEQGDGTSITRAVEARRSALGGEDAEGDAELTAAWPELLRGSRSVASLLINDCQTPP